VGASLIDHSKELVYIAAVIGTLFAVSIRPSFWKARERRRLAEQLLEVGVGALGFVCVVGVFIGISLVVQLSFWAGEAGQSQMLGPMLVAVVARELGPILINLILIVRSGSAMTTQLGVLKLGGEIHRIEDRGEDAFNVLLVPRVLAVAVSTFCLTIVFIIVTLFSGYVFAAWTGKGGRDLFVFVETIARAIQPKDVLSIVTRSILPALFASACCCVGGLGISAKLTDLPIATERALTHSIAGLFVVSVVVSLLTYF
jgi:phospholipid/cholesterol/gamma-HCH transport system permease protein